MSEGERVAEDRWPEWEDACGKVIQAARKLRPKMMQRDLDAFGDFGRVAGIEFALAGATKEEGEHYMKRILLMVLAEHQA